MTEQRAILAQIIAAGGALLLLITLILPGLPWLSYDNPPVNSERAYLDDGTLAAAIITVPVKRGANGTTPEELLTLGNDSYRMGDIAVLFDLELPIPSVFTRREFRVTAAQLGSIHPAGRRPTLVALAAYDDDVEIPLEELLIHSELALPRPALHESAAVLVELSDLLELLSIGVRIDDLLVTTGTESPLTQASAEETVISLSELADLAGITLPESTPAASFTLAALFSIAEVDLAAAVDPDQLLNLYWEDLNRQARLGWDETIWAQIDGVHLPVLAVLDEARVAVPLEPATVQRSALGLLDDYLLRAPGAFSLSLVLALFVCLGTLFLPAFGRRWRLWLTSLCALPTLLWLPLHLRSQNSLVWDTEQLLASLAPGYWLACLAVVLIAASAISGRLGRPSS